MDITVVTDKFGAMTKDINHYQYSDRYISGILGSVKSVAMVGASSNTVRPSFFVLRYLIDKGFNVTPVNNRSAGTQILGRDVYATLTDIPYAVDMVNIFRNSEAAFDITRDAIDIGAKVVWMQLRVKNVETAQMAEDAGLRVVMNRCPKIEYGRLSGEIGWAGVNTRTITNSRPKLAPKGFQHRLIKS